MAVENCPCGGSQLDRFYSLFTCDHANCVECHWTLNNCCNGCYSDTSNDNCNDSNCINYYDIKMQNVITSKVKAFGYCNNHKALAIQFIDGTKKLYLNVEKEVYDDLVALNRDTLYMYLEQNLCTEYTQCVNIP